MLVRVNVRLTDRAVLYAIARCHQRPASYNELAQTLECGSATIKRAIKRLHGAGYITPRGGGWGKAYDGYNIHLEAMPVSLRAEVERIICA